MNSYSVNVSDLLCRDEIQFGTEDIGEYISNNTILVTGAGGSIGSELCRQIIKFKPRLLIVFDIYENNVYELVNELQAVSKTKLDIAIEIGSVAEVNCLEKIFVEYKPKIIFHAAAYKHVVLMQKNIDQAVKNNIFGTFNVAECADKYNAEKFILLSTDKAVNPSSVMGMTKRICELIMQFFSVKSTTKYITVRFGNVLGSSGSVMRIFERQLIEGGPLTVTDKRATRYFMTPSEAVHLILEATGISQTGKIFILDMGLPININDLASNFIKLSGLEPEKDIKIIYTGLRAGEKLSEKLMFESEAKAIKKTCHDKIFMASGTQINSKKFYDQLILLKEMVGNPTQHSKLEKFMYEILSDYQ